MGRGFAAIRSMAGGPLWPLLAASGAGWVLMLVLVSGPPGLPLCTVHEPGTIIGGRLDYQALLFSAAMLSGMMAPLLAQNVTWVSRLSFVSRRWRAIALFLAGYACVWVIALSALWVLSNALRAVTGSEIAAVFAMLGLCLIWQGSPVKPAVLRLCHRVPVLPAFGLRADIASFGYGLTTAGWCVATCWALMSLPLVGQSAHVWLMAAVSPVMLHERYARPPGIRFRRGLVGTGLAMMAACVMAPWVKAVAAGLG
jgi:predicted metal-binding membrane protein